MNTLAPSPPVNAPFMPPDNAMSSAVNPLTASLNANVNMKSPLAGESVSLLEIVTVGATVSISKSTVLFGSSPSTFAFPAASVNAEFPTLTLPDVSLFGVGVNVAE